MQDLLGRTVARLVDGLQPAGRHSARFDAPALPPGVYFYRLVSGNFTRMRRMTLLK